MSLKCKTHDLLVKTCQFVKKHRTRSPCSALQWLLSPSLQKERSYCGVAADPPSFFSALFLCMVDFFLYNAQYPLWQDGLNDTSWKVLLVRGICHLTKFQPYEVINAPDLYRTIQLVSFKPSWHKDNRNAFLFQVQWHDQLSLWKKICVWPYL